MSIRQPDFPVDSTVEEFGRSLVSGTTLQTDDFGHYSTLEVHRGRFVEQDRHAPPSLCPKSGTDKIIHYDGKTYKEAVITEKSLPDPETSSTTRKWRVVPTRICRLRRRTFFILLAILIVIIIAVALGGGLGAAASRKSKKVLPSTVTNPTAGTGAKRYSNTGLAALQWTDPDGILYKRVYYQDKHDKIKESAWDNSTAFKTTWQINVISDAVKPATPLAAVAGWPHASYNYSLVKNVYYMSPNDELTERQAKANDSQSWEDDNFTGLYGGSNSTFLAAYWCQNIWNVSQELVVLFQRDNFENGITQARYTSANSSSNPWVANNFPFAQPKGYNFAMSLVSYRSGKHLMLYPIGNDDKLGQYEYTINDNVDSTSLVSITSEAATPLRVDPTAPIAVVAQDNQKLFTTDALPECYQQTPLTNLILFATADRASLVLSTWNCTAGFEDHTSDIEPLQKVNTTYLALAAINDRATGDGNIYIMFDAGKGPEVEEWTIPKLAGDAWTISRKVDTEFDLN